MSKTEVIERLEGFKQRLNADVVGAYATRGSEFGRERFAAWRRQISLFLDQSLPGMSAKLDSKLHHIAYFRARSESDLDVFMREDGNVCIAFIDSLLMDVHNDEFDFNAKPAVTAPTSKKGKVVPKTRVFVVHGHDQLLLTKVARFLERLGLEPVILHEQASKGMTIIEKIEANADVGFALVLYTQDDRGNKAADAEKGQLNDRARQNVIFEHGYLMAKLKRANVVPLMGGSVEIPSDISGVVYVDDTNWQVEVAKEMLAAGYDIDFNRVLKAR